MNNWQFGAELGAGVHGSIIDLVNPVWPGAVLKQSSPAALQDEAASLELLHHPNIVDLYGTAFVSHHHPPRIEDFLVVRRLGSSLATWNGDYSWWVFCLHAILCCVEHPSTMHCSAVHHV